MTKRELIDLLEATPHEDDADVVVYTLTEREEDGLDALEEEYPYDITYVDDSIPGRIDLNI